ncbi:hypothetical protein SLEP1_g16425 [Rubroshorea leprosula]|uniref:Uncharacterized protein n=1 Tax=Rubroshorea leprosula TaxID=152421 RepID=A0AAV5IUR5_9ROSI|nr:hypothetical protein SLEP1_g16425 [Rubroshorea leprosula]
MKQEKENVDVTGSSKDGSNSSEDFDFIPESVRGDFARNGFGDGRAAAGKSSFAIRFRIPVSGRGIGFLLSSRLIVSGKVRSSITIPYLREKKLWKLELWKWKVMVLVLICGSMANTQNESSRHGREVGKKNPLSLCGRDGQDFNGTGHSVPLVSRQHQCPEFANS